MHSGEDCAGSIPASRPGRRSSIACSSMSALRPRSLRKTRLTPFMQNTSPDRQGVRARGGFRLDRWEGRSGVTLSRVRPAHPGSFGRSGRRDLRTRSGRRRDDTWCGGRRHDAGGCRGGRHRRCRGHAAGARDPFTGDAGGRDDAQRAGVDVGRPAQPVLLGRDHPRGYRRDQRPGRGWLDPHRLHPRPLSGRLRVRPREGGSGGEGTGRHRACTYRRATSCPRIPPGSPPKARPLRRAPQPRPCTASPGTVAAIPCGRTTSFATSLAITGGRSSAAIEESDPGRSRGSRCSFGAVVGLRSHVQESAGRVGQAQ